MTQHFALKLDKTPMPKRYIDLFALVLCTCGAAIYFPTLLDCSALRNISEYLPATSSISNLDAESKLARSIKVELSTAEQYELELIPGLSSTIAIQILAFKGEIATQANTLQPNKKYKALLMIAGIGEIKAKEFEQYLELDL